MKQLNELRPYYQALSHIALQRIPMDLDNGVKKNYQLFQGVEISSEGKKKQTINLLAKIQGTAMSELYQLPFLMTEERTNLVIEIGEQTGRLRELQLP